MTQNGNQNASGTQHNPNTASQPQQGPATVGSNLHAGTSQANGGDAAENKYWRTQNTLGWFSVFLAFIAAGGGAASAYLASSALMVSQKALTASQDAAREAHRQADQATVQTGIFQKQVDISADANRMNAESGRAWLGSTTASIDTPLQVGSAITASVQYSNTGKEPAKNVLETLSISVYSEDEWYNDKAGLRISEAKDSCFAIKESNAQSISFPTPGFNAYKLSVGGPTIDPKQRQQVIADENTASGRNIVAINGCLVYSTIATIHHTAFCYKYQATVNELSPLMYCTVGNDAD